MASIHCKCGFIKNNIHDDHIGKRAKCPKCKAVVLVEKDKTVMPESVPTKDKKIKLVKKCPKCGSQKILSGTCSNCGVIVTKYLNGKKKKEHQNFIDKQIRNDIGKPPYFLEYCGWGLTIICIIGLIIGITSLKDCSMDGIFVILISILLLIIFLPPMNLILQQKFKKIYIIIRYLPLASVFIFLIAFFGYFNYQNNKYKKIDSHYQPDSSKSSSNEKTSWYKGGTLHQSTVDEWNNASYENKLATAADWANSVPRIETKVKVNGNMDTLKPFAKELLECVDNAATDKDFGSMRVSELASGCIVLMGW
ncbi:hypothetical protein DENIS_0116 [Desulfonema ishimotonii]|uniref:Uncharacterized protein n=1 Tax=Desulfonema ishimotonii TaxID=45657 RepID=A0A401FQE9_9BACT|nr:hypothetical protein [Desulfonema ishimotonii]GBC59180.1 hypothetical protein DENIS_0116 [Desulfonema ishimotonii]